MEMKAFKARVVCEDCDGMRRRCRWVRYAGGQHQRRLGLLLGAGTVLHARKHHLLSSTAWSDFQKRDDEKFLSHTFCFRTEDGYRLGYKPVVIDRYQPKERVY